MPKSRPQSNVVAALAALLLCGCIAGPVSLAPSTIPLTPGSYTETGPTSGKAVGVFLLGIPVSEANPSGLARDRAIENASAEALVNVSVDVYQIPLPFITIVVTTVKGNGVRLNK